MRKSTFLVVLLLLPVPSLSQPAPTPTRLFTSGVDIPALIAKARADQKSPNINSVEPIATFGPYRVLLEYRTGLHRRRFIMVRRN